MQENIPIEEVFENLRCSREGLTSVAAEERLVLFGHNKLEEKRVLIALIVLWFLDICLCFFVSNFVLLGVFQESKFLKFLGFMWNPLSWVMEAAAIMAIALANGGVSVRFIYFFSSSGSCCYFFENSCFTMNLWACTLNFCRGSPRTGKTLWEL